MKRWRGLKRPIGQRMPLARGYIRGTYRRRRRRRRRRKGCEYVVRCWVLLDSIAFMQWNTLHNVTPQTALRGNKLSNSCYLGHDPGSKERDGATGSVTASSLPASLFQVDEEHLSTTLSMCDIYSWRCWAWSRVIVRNINDCDLTL